MRDDAKINAAAELLTELFTFKQPADNVVNLYFRSRRYIGSKDRRFIADAVWAVLRRFGRYSEMSRPLTPRVALALYLKETGRDPALFFTGGQYAPLPLTKDEDIPFVAVPETAECPDWLRGRIDDDDIRAMTGEATLDLRVNTLKADRNDVLRELAEYGAVATAYSPVGVRLNKRISLATLPAYREGRVEVQDEGSQIVALLSGAKPSDTVVDWCAGAGGKTLALSSLMNARGTIYAIDADVRRLKDLPDRARRAGAANVVVLSDYAFVKPADLVLVDAPCTGTGTWRRAPDARWRMTAEQGARICAVQADILNKASARVKKGGALFYITCSLDRRENEDQIDAFLAGHDEFALVDLSADLKRLTNLSAEGKTVRLSPSKTGTDGFFAAKLVRL